MSPDSPQLKFKNEFKLLHNLRRPQTANGVDSWQRGVGSAAQFSFIHFFCLFFCTHQCPKWCWQTLALQLSRGATSGALWDLYRRVCLFVCLFFGSGLFAWPFVFPTSELLEAMHVIRSNYARNVISIIVMLTIIFNHEWTLHVCYVVRWITVNGCSWLMDWCAFVFVLFLDS